MEFRPGETLLVSGATGNFGSATVTLALAMGARCVVAPGRNAVVLDDLRQRFGERLVPVRLTGDGDTDTTALRAAAPDPIDAVQDFVEPVRRRSWRCQPDVPLSSMKFLVARSSQVGWCRRLHRY